MLTISFEVVAVVILNKKRKFIRLDYTVEAYGAFDHFLLAKVAHGYLMSTTVYYLLMDKLDTNQRHPTYIIS